MLSIYDQIAISERAAPIPFPFRPYSPPIKIKKFEHSFENKRAVMHKRKIPIALKIFTAFTALLLRNILITN